MQTITRETMTKVQAFRMMRGMKPDELVNQIVASGYAVTLNQYMACEDGRTQRVPLDLVITAAMILEIPSATLFPQLPSSP